MPLLQVSPRTSSLLYFIILKKHIKESLTAESGKSGKICCLCWNVRSINNKTNEIKDYVLNNFIKLYFVSETWLTDMNNHTTAIIKCYGFEIKHHFRSSQYGGGVAIIHKPYLKVMKVPIKHPDTFETISVKIKLSNNKLLFCCCVYRTGLLQSFMNDFDSFIGDVFPQFDKLLFCGDINIHLDEISKHSTAFCDILHLMVCISM